MSTPFKIKLEPDDGNRHPSPLKMRPFCTDTFSPNKRIKQESVAKSKTVVNVAKLKLKIKKAKKLKKTLKASVEASKKKKAQKKAIKSGKQKKKKAKALQESTRSKLSEFKGVKNLFTEDPNLGSEELMNNDNNSNCITELMNTRKLNSEETMLEEHQQIINNNNEANKKSKPAKGKNPNAGVKPKKKKSKTQISFKLKKFKGLRRMYDTNTDVQTRKKQTKKLLKVNSSYKNPLNSDILAKRKQRKKLQKIKKLQARYAIQTSKMLQGREELISIMRKGVKGIRLALEDINSTSNGHRTNRFQIWI